MRRGVMSVLDFGLYCILRTILPITIGRSILNFYQISLENWGLESIKRNRVGTKTEELLKHLPMQTNLRE